MNYYAILGVSENATYEEIRSAFRRLAKAYHPDRNPEGKEQFELIVRAYETLTDPVKKASYDYRRKQSTFTEPPRETKQKTWSFDEKELKRRQYYNEHLKKYEKATAAYNPDKHKSNYNEFKYILFATPLAVALFIFIMSLAGKKLPPPPAHPKNVHPMIAAASTNQSVLESPYDDYFGKAVYDSRANCTLTINNESGKDAIICIFARGKFVRSCFIRTYYYTEVSQLPCVNIHVRYFTGTDFDVSRKVMVAGINGTFINSPGFYETIQPLDLTGEAEIKLVPGEDEAFRKITEVEFFNKTVL
jgi:curved DNA-binding protein CbpA